MGPHLRPQAWLRALKELGVQGLQAGGKHAPPPPPGPAWQHRVQGVRRQILNCRGQSQQHANFSSSAPQAATTTRNIAQDGWAFARSVFKDSWDEVFRGVRRNGNTTSHEMGQYMRAWGREAQKATVKRQHGFYRSMQGRAAHPFQSSRMTTQMTQPMHGNGLQAARNFSSGPTAALLFHNPLAIRLAADEVEDWAKDSFDGKETVPEKIIKRVVDGKGSSSRTPKGSAKSSKNLRRLRSPRRSGSQCSIPFQRLVIQTEAEPAQPQVARVAAKDPSTSLEASTSSIVPPSPSVTSTGDFDYYFTSPHASSRFDDEDVTTVLCVPLDPDLTTIFSTHGNERLKSSANGSSSSSQSLVDRSYIGQVERMHASYEYHALRYIVPLEHALDMPIWRRHLPRDWNMNLLVISAIDGVQRGDHCLEIRFQGTPAHVIERLLFETMGESRARWYMAFLSEERPEYSETGSSADDEAPVLAQALSPLLLAPSLPSAPESHLDSSGVDLEDEIESLGAASRLSFDELGTGYQTPRSDDQRSASLVYSTRDDELLQFLTLAIARDEHRSEFGFASAFLSRYSDDLAL